jgi:hypothetical protein
MLPASTFTVQYSGILGGAETVQNVIRERLIAGLIFVIRDAKDIPVVCA